MVVPQASDSACSRRELRPITSPEIDGSNISVGASAIAAFSGAPLASASLTHVVSSVTRADRGLPQLEGALPFSVDGHACSKSHIAQQMLTRLRSDVNTFANQQNQSKTACFKGMTL